MWITVNYLGAPDNGVIITGYLGSLLMAGGFLAIGSCMSALTRNQVIAFILDRRRLLRVPARRLSAGARRVRAAGRRSGLVDAIASLSFLTHFEALSKGVIDLRDVLYFAMTIAFFLVATSLVLDARKSD
jgi:ABC-2 type transport system permease protein